MQRHDRPRTDRELSATVMPSFLRPMQATEMTRPISSRRHDPEGTDTTYRCPTVAILENAVAEIGDPLLFAAACEGTRLLHWPRSGR